MPERDYRQPIDSAGPTTLEGGDFPEFLDQVPHNFLAHIIKESLRSPVTRLIEAAMVANDAILAGLEADAYLRDPHKGADLYEAGGSTVVIGPGFGAKGKWYGAAKTFFKNAGFRVVIYGEDEHNLMPLEQQVPDFAQFVEEAAQDAGDKVDVWLHSKAGLMGYGAHTLHTKQMVENVDHVAAVGTGLTKWANPLILGAYFGSQFAFNGRDFEWAKEMRGNARSTTMDGLRVTTIANKLDPIMRCDYFGDDVMPIEGSHIGNGWSLETLRASVEVFRSGQKIEISEEITPRHALVLAA